MKDYEVLIKGYNADTITDRIAQAIIDELDLDKLKNEVRNKITKELKNDIISSADVQKAIQSTMDRVSTNATDRVQQAVSKKIAEINSINLSSLTLQIKDTLL